MKKTLILILATFFVSSCSDRDHFEAEIRHCVNHYRAESYKVALESCEIVAESSTSLQDAARASWLMGNIYYFDLAGLGKSKSKGFKRYLDAAERGWPRAMTFVGESYLYADGVEEDLGQAYFWLHKAAEFKDPDAEFALGMMYYNGVGRDKDLSTAIAWFKRSAFKQHWMSINNLTWIYATSANDSFRNVKQATYWKEILTFNSTDNPIFLDTIAAAHAIALDFDLAIEFQNKAILALEKSNEAGSVEDSLKISEFKVRLAAYENKEAWIESHE